MHSFQQAASASSGLELRCKIDRSFGIPRSIGLEWMDAAREGSLRSMKKIVEHLKTQHSGKMNTADNKSDDALHPQNEREAVWRLVHYNGQGTSYGFIGSTALHWAAANGDTEMLAYLLEGATKEAGSMQHGQGGCSVNVQNHGGSTALHSAVGNGQLATVKILVQHGANVTIEDCCGDAPLDVCNNHLHTVTARSERSTFQQIASLLGGYELAGKMIAASPSTWSSSDMKSMAALMVAAGAVTQEAIAGAAVDRSELAALCQDGLHTFQAVAQRASEIDDEAAFFLRGVKERHHQQLVDIQNALRAGHGDDGDADAEKLHAERAKNKGNQHFQKAEFPKAIQMYTLAISIDSLNGTYYSNRSAAYMKQAEFAMNTTTTTARTDGGTSQTKGMKLMKLAFQDAKKAVELRPDWPKSYHRLGTTAFRLGRLSLAKSVFEEGLRLVGPPSSKEAQDAATQLQDGLHAVTAELAAGRIDRTEQGAEEDAQEEMRSKMPFAPSPGMMQHGVAGPIPPQHEDENYDSMSDEDRDDGADDDDYGYDDAPATERDEFERFAAQFGNDPARMMAELERRAFGPKPSMQDRVAKARQEEGAAGNHQNKKNHKPTRCSSSSSSDDDDSSYNHRQTGRSGGASVAAAAVPPAQRKPWFDCPLCDNKTRDQVNPPCCGGALCGTCWRRRQNNSCPLCNVVVV